MTVFGDSEPEDAWHPDDPRPVLIRNVARRIALLDDGPIEDDLAVLRDRLIHWLEDPRTRSQREVVRAELIQADLDWLCDG